jgi:hypothetical protein
MAADSRRHFRGCPERVDSEGLPQSRAEVVDLQVRAMRSTAENVRASLSTFAAAVAQSPERLARVAADPAGEIADAFELIVRRIYALIDSAEKVAKQGDGPQTEPEEPS